MGLGAGTYTFLFTDIAGSTRLLQADEEAMVAAVDRHDALLLPLFEAHGGHVFKNMGDAYCVAFPGALPALRAAIAAQRALSDQVWILQQPLRVRMALHTGPARLREEDYRGVALSRVARLLGSAAGGQILVSGTTGAELSAALPDGITLLDLGSVRLRSLERPERVCQVVAPGLGCDFPPLRSLENIPNNLKNQLTSFIGREDEMVEVMDLCLSRRLVTLTGTGGGGKTRLALQVAGEMLDDFEDGVWVAELAGITDASTVPFVVAAELQVRQEGGQSVEDALIAYLEPRRLLLVLDNCEHLIDAAARLAQALLQAAPGLKILATSRERLNIAGETVWRVPPLSGPSGRASVSVDAILESDAASLFVERAMAAQPRFRLSAGNAKAVAQVCRRLEGLPLALELAASRVGVMPVEQFAMRLDDRLRQLASGPRGGAARHRTIQATLDWSFELLTEPERLLLCRLSVFAGGWTLDAAESICSGEGIEVWNVLDLLSRLIDKSLVVLEEQAGTARYRLLETLRGYSQEKLGIGTDADDLRRRHAAYFLDWAEVAEPYLSGPEQADWLNKIEDDHDNLRAALKHLGDTDAEAFQRLASALYQFWYTRGYLTEGRTWLELAVAKANAASTPIRARAVNLVGVFAWVQGKVSLAAEMFETSLSMRRGLGDRVGVAASLNNIAMIASNEGNFEKARSCYMESLDLWRSCNMMANTATALNNLGVLAEDQGDYHAAIKYHEESLTLYEPLGDQEGIVVALINLGQSYFLLKNISLAVTCLKRALQVSCATDNKFCAATALDHLGALFADSIDPIAAVTMLAAATALHTAIGSVRSLLAEQQFSRSVRMMHEQIDADRYETAWAAGSTMSLSEAVAYCLDGFDLHGRISQPSIDRLYEGDQSTPQRTPTQDAHSLEWI